MGLAPADGQQPTGIVDPVGPKQLPADSEDTFDFFLGNTCLDIGALHSFPVWLTCPGPTWS